MTDRRLQLGLAGAGLLLAALDAYAVVTLLPQMLEAVDLPIDHVEAAAPILTGFLGGYVVAMPLLGAFSDARGRLPAFAAALGAFAAGSIVTALAPALGWLVVGRVVQGLGGGALVPLSLALAADLYQGRSRGLAIGTVSALQEAGSVIGPVYGAALAAGLGGWRAVFWLNVPLGVLILAGLWMALRRGRPAAPHAGGAGRRDVEWAGALLLGGGLALAVVALYPDDPGNRPVNANVLPLAAAAIVVLAAFGWRQARHLTPLVTRGLLRSRVFGGSMVANVLAGGALMVALVDVPILARGVYSLDTLQSGLLLSRFLLGIPFGALAGGWMAGWLGQRATSAAGLVVAGVAFVLMSGWSLEQLGVAGAVASAELVACGVGFGLVIAPLSLAVLDRAGAGEHGVAGSLVVLSRTVGMVLALSALTAFGLARLQRILVARHCDTITAGPGSLVDKLSAYETCVRGGLLQEYREIFLVAAALCGLAALVAVATLPSRAARRAASQRGRPEAALE
ncbi:MAG TPA: MFS transporter [Candidatus Dormibacteraeota bacterium]|nr:MFS transporter [Candidatus Dormibacteraeota bacterium]